MWKIFQAKDCDDNKNNVQHLSFPPVSRVHHNVPVLTPASRPGAVVVSRDTLGPHRQALRRHRHILVQETQHIILVLADQVGVGGAVGEILVLVWVGWKMERKD